jgi:serine/threonine protein phosphatase PrpC
MHIETALAQRSHTASDHQSETLFLDQGIFALACGKGGTDGGLGVARLALDCVRDRGAELSALRAEASAGQPEAKLALLDALAGIFLEATTRLHGDSRGLASMSMAVLAGSRLFIAHVGNTRIDLLRGGQQARLTLDHSVAAERVRRGLMRPEDLPHSPLRRTLFQALGRIPAVSADQLEIALEDGDIIVLSTEDVLAEPQAWRPLVDGRDLHRGADLLVDAAARDRACSPACVLVQASPTRASQGEAGLPLSLGGPRIDEVLSWSPLFSHFDSSARHRIAPYLEELALREGEPLFMEGQDGQHLYVLLTGELAVSRAGTELTRLQAGAHLGEIGLALGGPRSATVTATRPSRLLGLHRDQLNQLLQQRPELAGLFMQALVEQLAGRVVDLSERITAI